MEAVGEDIRRGPVERVKKTLRTMGNISTSSFDLAMKYLEGIGQQISVVNSFGLFQQRQDDDAGSFLHMGKTNQKS